MSNSNWSAAVVRAILLVAFCAVISSSERLLFEPLSSDREIEQKNDNDVQDNAFVVCPDGSKCPSKCCKVGNRFKCCTRDTELTNHYCPDGKSYCKDKETCCLQPTGKFGCCPFSQAVCCPNMLSCCPYGSVCDATSKTCKHSNGSTSKWLLKVPATEIPELTNHNCPDGKSYCSDGQTCCLMSTGKYGCCPFSQAVCCPDRSHCCPYGSTCDTVTKTCKSYDGLITDWVSKVPAKELPELTNHYCPDGKSYCKDSETCCVLSTGKFGCCPHSQAVCCPDMKTCCPYGSVCDTASKTCKHSNGLTSNQLLKIPATEISELTNHYCPDGKSYCKDSETCCVLPTGKFGCCPHSQAVCCPNMLVCCPYGTICDAASKTCKHSNGLASYGFLKAPENEIVKPKNHHCPDGKSYCQDSQTCCLMSTGKYGCCPFSQAVCCPDRSHCCPYGSKCDTATKTCKTNDGLITDWVSKVPAKQNPELTNHNCPDGKSYCSDGQTCCLMSNGKYGCCPFSQAVCCPDRSHCCPYGSKCDTVTKTCKSNNGLTIDWVQKVPAKPIPVDVPIAPLEFQSSLPTEGSEVQCSRPDNGVITHLCPVDHGCCFGDDNIPVCCQNNTSTCCNGFCCPSGYACGKEKSECLKDEGPMVALLP